MALMRFSLDLAIPMAIYNTIPAAKKIAFRDAVLVMKAYAVKINAGLPNEEMTVTAKYHLCRNDEGRPCDEEVEI